MRPLFEPTTLGKIPLKNRIVMAPMTRSRALHNIPNELMAKYYGQRAGAGLIITEGVSPSLNGLGYARIPGLFNADHVKGWRLVTEAVHKNGGKIFIQLMHTGRVGHPLNLPHGALVFGPSAIAAPGEIWTDEMGQQPFPVPLVMNETEIQKAIQEFAHASELAMDSGFDGVELHGANGYLIDQFLNVASNQRGDIWGGSIENRLRFAVEVAAACAKKIGGDRVGIRVSPYGAFNGMTPDPQMDFLYEQLSLALNKVGLVYIHVVDHSSMGAPTVPQEIKAKIRGTFRGQYILSGGYDAVTADADLEAKRGDLVAFGRPFISNPDLPEKLKSGQELLPADPETFYTPGEKGYTDYSKASLNSRPGN